MDMECIGRYDSAVLFAVLAWAALFKRSFLPIGRVFWRRFFLLQMGASSFMLTTPRMLAASLPSTWDSPSFSQQLNPAKRLMSRKETF